MEAATDADRALAPDGLKQQLTGTDSTGAAIAVNYDGDIVLRQEYQFKARIVENFTPKIVEPWPPDFLLPESLERNAERLRLSLTLAVQRESHAVILPTWRYIENPFAHAHMANAWSDPRNAAGIMPIKLTSEELAIWVEWYKILSNPHADRIKVAVGRSVRALAERRERSDILIDAVIAWENLFGTSKGESTLRISASLALLLESDPAKRKELRSRLSKVYTLRSNIVHGNKSLHPNDTPMCYEALDVALRAVRVLAKDRPDVLELKDGDQRSMHLILGAQGKPKVETN